MPQSLSSGCRKLVLGATENMSDATTEIGKNDEEPSSLSVYNALDRPSIGVQQPSWHRYVPGPNYARYRKSLDARWMRAGTVACGGGCLMLSGYSKFP